MRSRAEEVAVLKIRIRTRTAVDVAFDPPRLPRAEPLPGKTESGQSRVAGDVPRQRSESHSS